MADARPTVADSLYGADASGLICGWWFRPDEPPLPLQRADDALPCLQGRGPGFVWLHFNLSHAGSLAWMRRHADLSADFFEALETDSRSTRLEREGDALFGVINDLVFDFELDAGDVATLWLQVRSHVLISSRRQPLRSVDRLRTDVKRGASPTSAITLLGHLLRDQADELHRIVRRAADRIDDIEDQLLAGHLRSGPELARLRRLMVRLQRLLAPEPTALQRLLTAPPAWVSPADVELLHGSSEDFALVLRDIVTLQERAKLMQDEASNRVAEANGRSLFTLTMVTVLALPINLMAGLFGMNVGGIPWGQHPAGFWIMLSLIGVLTALIAWLAVRRLRAG